MCLIIFGVFAVLSFNAYTDNLTTQALIYGAIALFFALLLARRIYKNRHVLFGKKKDI